MRISRFARYALIVSAIAMAGCSAQPLTPVAGDQADRQATPQRFKALFSFDGSDGACPAANLLVVGRKLYGTTSYGLKSGPGNVFSMTLKGHEHVLYTFSPGSGGGEPASALLYLNGALYGTTIDGGTESNGTVFEVPKAGGSAKTLESFETGYDGGRPKGGLVYFRNALYGTTSSDGADHGGTVFRLSLSGGLKTVHSFGGSGDGNGPASTLTVVGRALYGTTTNGGAYNSGTVFEIDKSGNERVVYSFGRTSRDGSYPLGALLLVNGKLYGTTVYGGPHGESSYGDGIVFSIDGSGREHILHTFQGSDGANPVAGLTYVNGVFYGTTWQGGNQESSEQFGTIFRMSSSGKESVIHSFTYKDGAEPRGGLTFFEGKLYGTTCEGGQNPEFGEVFRYLLY
jgi:uncharacterized repeat protein (TIGR03803 family)